MLKPTIKIAPSSSENDSFWLLYEPVVLFHESKKGKIFLGNKEPKICRFCNRDSSSTTFKMNAHVLPEFMGNKSLLSYYECDQCNSHFSKYETALSNFGGIMNTLSLLQGKKSVPKFKSKDERLQIKFNSQENILNVRATAHNVPNDTDKREWGKYVDGFKISDDKKTITFKTTKPSYIPRHVFKAFVKVGFGLLPIDSLPYYEKARKWLINEIDDEKIENLSLFHVYRQYGKLLKKPVVYLARKKKLYERVPSPENALLIFYGLYKFQVFLPFNENDEWLWNQDEIYLPIENHLVRNIEVNSEGDGTGEVNKIDLSTIFKVTDEEDHLSFGLKEGKFL